MSRSATDYTALYALAAHALADFPLQADWMAENKMDSGPVRAAHVAVHVLSFVPLVLKNDWNKRQAVAFLGTIAATHFTIDSRRWNDAVPIWFDQALHVISLAVALFTTEVLDDD